MTIGDIEKRARLILTDTFEDQYRFLPIEMFSALADAITDIRAIRPETRYVKGILTDDTMIVGSRKMPFQVPDSFPMPIDSDNYGLDEYRSFGVNMDERWREALVYYVVFKMYLKDDTDTNNASLASTYSGLYQKRAMQ